MTKLSRPWPIIIISTTIVVSLFTYIFPDSILRPLLMLWFLLLCPGMAWVRLMRLDDVMAEVSLALGLSISLDALITGIFLYSNAWSPDGIFITLLLISLAGASIQLASRKLSVPSFFSRRTHMRPDTTTALALVSSFTQQETQSLPTLLPSLTTQQKVQMHDDEIQTQLLPVQKPSLSKSLKKVKIQEIPDLLASPACEEDEDDDTIKTPRVVIPSKSEKQEKEVPDLLTSPACEEVMEDDDTAKIPRVVVEKQEKERHYSSSKQAF